jgi:hypothetical protein
MNKGVVVIAHNNRKVDYAKMAIVAAKFAKKNLSVPVTLLTDASTIEWMQESGTYTLAQEIFENIVPVPRPSADNQRVLYDGTAHDKIPFLNSNRCSVWEHTPYDRTLLIDSDFIINSPSLNNYWHLDEDLLIADGFNDIQGDRMGVLDKWTSETGVHLYWATTVMFTKNQNTRTFFQLVDFVRENYRYYADLFRFRSDQYRNDISFSVAKHILDGFEKRNIALPSILTVQDKDILEKINDDGRMIFSVKSWNDPETFTMASIKDQDVHIMNKQSVIRNFERLIDL